MGLNPIRITTSIQADQGTVDFDFPFGRRAKPSLIRFIPYLFNAIIIYSSCYKRLFLGGGLCTCMTVEVFTVKGFDLQITEQGGGLLNHANMLRGS